MITSIRYDKSLGNSALAVRLRNATGQFWNFSTLAWVNSQVSACLTYLSEAADGDPTESLYVSAITVPSGGPFIQEIITVSDGLVIGADTTSDNEIGSAVSDLSTILDVNQGDWEISGTQMIFYRRDGSELMRFDLKDNNGQASASSVFKREKV